MVANSDQYPDWDNELGPPVCERCGEPCHHCAFDFEEDES